MECREVREYLPAYLDGLNGRQVEEHLKTCPDCRAELTAFRALAQELASLETAPQDPPSWLLDDLLASVGSRAAVLARRAARRSQLLDPKIAAAGGAVVLAGVASAWAVRARRRRRRRAGRRLREALAQA